MEWDPQKCIQIELPLEEDIPTKDSISSDVLVVEGEQVKYKTGGIVQFGVWYNDTSGILISDTSRKSELKTRG